MINVLDDIIEDLIQSRLAQRKPPIQVEVGFQPPDDDWRKAVSTGNKEHLNVYLYDIRENLKLRSNERHRQIENGFYLERRDPPVLNCAYLITAWSPVAHSPATHPTHDEHRLLYAVGQVLLRHRSLVVAEVYRPGIVIPSSRAATSVPLRLREEELPRDVAQPDGAHEFHEFWSTMKGAWKPGLKVTVALPVFLLEPEFESPMVTTLIGDYRQSDAPTTAEAWHTVGGHVLAGSSAVDGAHVTILGMAPPEVQAVDRSTRSQKQGRFVFSGLRSGRYRIRAVKEGLQDQVVADVPNQTNGYDLRLT